MKLRTLVAGVALWATAAFGQTSTGEIAGRMSMRDERRSELPGVRVMIADGNQTRETVTDISGRFAFRSLRFGTYRVVAELAGFNKAVGELAVSPSSPRAFLAWSLEIGCLAEVQRVDLAPREAARVVAAIVHVRVIEAPRPVLVSLHPACSARVLQAYEVEFLASAGAVATSPGRSQLFMEPQEARLAPGSEYVALLGPEGHTTSDLVFPIVEGRVASPHAGELHGMRTADALRLLGKWSSEQRH